MAVLRRGSAKPHRFTENPLLQLPLPGWRSRMLTLFFVGLFVVLAGRAFYLQVINNEFLQDKGQSRYRRDLAISASRGKISDRHGNLLAVSTPMKSIWAIPADARLEPEQTQALARLLEISPKELTRRLATDKNFVYLQRQVSPEIGDKIRALDLPGIHQDKEFRRFYPAGDMMAHIVGFTGVDDAGLEGVELAYHRALVGHPGSRSVIRDRRGQIVEDVGGVKLPQDGEDIRLALDSKIQYLAFSAIQQAVIENQAKAAGAVVLDARTGEVLALANWPSYNPNNRAQLTGPSLRNRAVTDSFEPGSTLKPFTVALALERGKFRFDSMIDCSPGRITIGRATISDAHPHGVLSVAQVIQKSSNVGTVKIASSFAPKEMWEMYDLLGFGTPPGLGFPGEVGGRLRAWKNWKPIEQATMSYGHGISVSLIQLARAYMVFAREGDLLPLSLLYQEQPPSRGVQVFSPQTVREMRTMLEMAAGPGGTAPKAQIPGYRIGGKTGTAYKLEGGVYARKYVSSFVGLAPMSDPRFIVAVMVDEPSAGKHYGGSVAGPVFAQIMSGTLRAFGVVPDAPVENNGSNVREGRL